MPITFSVWIEGVVGSAGIIADRKVLRRVWINGEKGITSMRSFDEAYEQLIGDLDALGYLETYSRNAGLSEDQQVAIREYIETFKNFDELPFIKNKVLDYEMLLNSHAWELLEKKAQSLVLLFNDR